MPDIVKGTISSDKGANSGTLSVTVDAGLNRYLLVTFGIYDTTEADRVLTVDYNGDTMTRLGGATRGANREIELWGLADPDVGTHDVTFTFAGAVTEWSVVAIPLINVGDINVLDTSAGTGTTSRSVTLTTTRDRCQIYSYIILTVGAASIVSDSGQTIIKVQNSTNHRMRTSEEDAVVTPIGDESSGFSWVNSAGSAVLNVALFPSFNIKGTPIFF